MTKVKNEGVAFFVTGQVRQADCNPNIWGENEGTYFLHGTGSRCCVEHQRHASTNR